MSPTKMHADEVETDVRLVRRLVAGQFPQWAQLPVEAVPSAGTDNTIYRLGDDMSVRLPRRPSSIPQVEREQHWLPRLAPQLPVAIPIPLAQGAPAEGYPWTWSVYRWLPGVPATHARIEDRVDLARQMAGFLKALQSVDASDGPLPGPENFYRGTPLAMRDASVRRSLAAIEAMPDLGFDVAAATAAWDEALRAAEWDGPPVWIHGDLLPGNLLIEDGRLSAVIDFGCMGVGDPACDLQPAWAVLDAPGREAFRAALDVDDASWARGRGWALSMVNAIPYYHETNPVLAGVARRAMAEVLAG